jgi:hypothetical protein
MGTRAAFWQGDPRNLEKRRWLGCIAWDGYPSGLEELDKVSTEEEFLATVEDYKKRDDFADPANGGWPFPWSGDIFLTDYTYAWIDGRLMVTCCHAGFVTWAQATSYEALEWPEEDTLPANVPAPTGWDMGQPDSIMIFASAGHKTRTDP